MVKYTKTEVMRALKDYGGRGEKWAKLLVPVLNKEFADRKTDEDRYYAIKMSKNIVKGRLPVLKLNVDDMTHQDFIKAMRLIESKASLFADWWVDVEEVQVTIPAETRKDKNGRLYTVRERTVSGWNGAIYYQPLPNKLED
nr:MAG TPA: hypothetical protein [Caudoviricetes sp.]